MVAEHPKKELLTRPNRRVFGILLALLVFLVPFTAFMVQNLASQDQVVQVSQGQVDASEKQNLGRVARYIHGEVEFYYNDWLYTVDSDGKDAETTPIYLPTPGHWTGQGNNLPASGYGSYRYVIHGLEPGTEIKVYPIVEVANRVYINGILCSEVGYPSRSMQSGYVDLSHEVIQSSYVPASGIVEYVMEVGNCGAGGSKRIGIIYMESTFIDDLSTLPFALIATGSIIAVLAFLALGVILSLRRETMFALSLLATFALLFFLFSTDSPFVVGGLFYGGALFHALSAISLAVMTASVLLYERLTHKKVFYFGEQIVILSILVISTATYCATLGTNMSVYFYLVLASFPIYMFVRHFIQFLRDLEGIKLATIYGSLASIGLVTSMAETNFSFIADSAYAAALSLILCMVVLASAFHEIYFDSLREKDQAVLIRRYHQISSRALSRASNASEAVATLDYIGQGYNRSLRIGDKRLLTFSTLTRRRLLALREDSIGLEEECELEGKLFDLRQAVHGGQGSLILDVEESSKRIPPLLFESAIDSLSKELEEGEVIVLSETKRTIVLNYPKRLTIQDKVLSAIQERITLVGLSARVSSGAISIRKKGEKR